MGIAVRPGIGLILETFRPKNAGQLVSSSLVADPIDHFFFFLQKPDTTQQTPLNEFATIQNEGGKVSEDI